MLQAEGFTVSLKQEINDQVKQAMKGGEKARLKVLRMLTAAIKQKEVDERVELDDAQVLAIIDKQVKQRRESIEQYTAGGRADLAAAEQAEIDILSEFLPEPLGDDELAAMIDQAITESGASSMADMGKVMGQLKPKVQGRADMKKVSAAVRAKLG
ncbi:MAG: GatB/YqeY domain-containing protein [Wenzhouxiangellaceae bacterium]|nr:GatB/YqeY domain-containing protein [Wenzhouxiangellaceae bacterium]MBS3823567.1 GatB/YqeY domain-containing protein [Wenzhouxiangellaceae bacterium]